MSERDAARAVATVEDVAVAVVVAEIAILERVVAELESPSFDRILLAGDLRSEIRSLRKAENNWSRPPQG